MFETSISFDLLHNIMFGYIVFVLCVAFIKLGTIILKSVEVRKND